MPQIDRKDGVARNHRRRIGRHVEAADGELDVVTACLHRRIERLDHAHRREQRVLALVLAGRARMRLFAMHAHPERAFSLDARDDADHVTLALEDRTLLDVRLDIRRDIAPQGP